ncbi:hypothetical protein WMY93_032534 [Mugilogobius chulae]|uniref:Ig-like domain-containing protein n=1 Tax=Mugilogobius chulae TaxID=88201 RepID=A0AAW0MNA8_9GOBI
METCVLPCSFDGSNINLIQWVQTEKNVLVHAHQYGTDQLQKQDQAFRGRTSLFPELISGGNTSLQLTQVKVSDQGTYLCQVFTTVSGEEHLIHLRVEGPFRSLQMKFKEDVLTCSSKNIYPEPKLTWAPDSSPQTQLQLQQNQLFSISSSLTLKLHPPQRFTCNISTEHSWKSATYSFNSPVQMSSDVSLSCSSSSSARVKSLKWTFNSLETILTQTGADVSYSDTWRPFVERVSESGDLSLKNLSSKHQGLYLCEVHTQQHVHFSRTQLGQEPGESGPGESGPGESGQESLDQESLDQVSLDQESLDQVSLDQVSLDQESQSKDKVEELEVD